MKFEEIKNTLVSSERQVIDLRDKANSEDGNDSTRFALRNLIELRVNAFIEAIALPTPQFLELLDAMREARV